MDPENWTTKFARLDVHSGSNFGGKHGSEAEADRGGVEGEGGLGGGAGGLHGEPIGVEVRRSCDADRALEAAVGGTGGGVVFRRPSPREGRPAGVDRRPLRADRPVADGAGVVEKKICPVRLRRNGRASSRSIRA